MEAAKRFVDGDSGDYPWKVLSVDSFGVSIHHASLLQGWLGLGLCFQSDYITWMDEGSLQPQTTVGPPLSLN